tara:strand:+ start:366 stop:1142 length:777 start_codon:yes stop_codon:yes gene_type:complete
MTDVSAAAAALISARHENRVMDELPGGMPQNMNGAYAIQDGIVAAMDDAIAGWKVAFTNVPGQQKMGVDGPGAGPIFASYVMESPGKMTMPDPGLRISECEFAFRLNDDLPAKESAYTDDDIRAVIGSVHPAIEIVNRRLSSTIPMSGLAVILDHGGNGGFAYGPGTKDWAGVDYANHALKQIINGEEKAVGSGGNVMDGNPIASITWLANHLKPRGQSLKAGDWVSSGSAAEMLPVPDGGTVTGDFGSLGTVEVSFS